ncbi:nucleoside diphosphate kinase, partial [Kipferlia bialata]|eukprot:g767.t1
MGIDAMKATMGLAALAMGTSMYMKSRNKAAKLLKPAYAYSGSAQDRHAYFVGGGLASLSGAAYLIRDCGFKGENIHIYEGLPILGGSNDGIGSVEGGFVCRGGRMLQEETYENFWELFRSIPSLDSPGKSLTDEILDFDHAHGTWCQMVQMEREEAETFYAEHQGRPFFPALVSMMTSAPCLVMKLTGPDAIKTWRGLLGPTNPETARATQPGCIRALYAIDGTRNAAHGSDSPASAERELDLCFKEEGSTASGLSPVYAFPQVGDKEIEEGDRRLAVILVRPHVIREGLAHVAVQRVQ